MSYKKATQILPQELLSQVQEYIDGEFLYIPRLSAHKKTGVLPPRPVRNCVSATNASMQITARGRAWNLWRNNTFCH